MQWYGQPIDDFRVRIPRTLPPYTEDSDIDKVRRAFEDKATHKGIITRDVVAVYAPKPHKGPITLELHEVSRDDSPNNRDDNRRKLENKILYRVRDRFDSKISVLGYFNRQELFRWPPVYRP